MRYLLQCEAQSPLALPWDRSQTNFRGCNNFITGTALRGGVASWYLREIADASDVLFNKLFIEEEVKFGPLYPVRYNKESQVIPLTASTCKRNPGFLPNGHGVVDMLLKGTAPAHRVEEFCSICAKGSHEEILKPYFGFMEPVGKKQWRQVGVQKRMITHSAIGGGTGTAVDGSLHSFEVINEGECFSGMVDIPDQSVAEGFEKVFGAGGQELRIGRGKTRGFGLVLIKEIQKTQPVRDLPQRWEKFNQAAVSDGFPDDSWYFSVTLQSDTILHDEFFMPVLSLEANRIQKLLNFSNMKLELLKSVKENSVVSSWNYILGLPRDDEVAITKGSVFLYRVTQVDQNELLLALENLETHGIGARKAEGFGQIRVCDPFHWEMEEK